MLSPSEIAHNFIKIGSTKTKLSSIKLFTLGIFAGMFIAFTGAATVIASATVDNPSIARLIMAFIFPGGLTMVMLAGSELFTGNSLIIISVLEKTSTVKSMLRNWVMVFLGNFTGALFVTILFVFSHLPSMFDGALATNLVSLAEGKVALPFMDAFLRGISCNILVCIAVWIAFAALTVPGKVIGLYLPIVVFVLCGFEHCIANMFYIPAGILTAFEYGIPVNGLTWGSFLLKNLLPVTLGNIVGGAGVVGFGYWFIYLRSTPGSKLTKEQEQQQLDQAGER